MVNSKEVQEEKQKISTMIKLSITLEIMMILFMVIDYFNPDFNNLILFSIMIIAFTVMQFILIKYRNDRLAEHILLTSGIIILSSFHIDDQLFSTIAWSFLFPLLAFTIARFNVALFYSILLLVILIAISIFLNTYPHRVTADAISLLTFFLALGVALFFVVTIEKRRLKAMQTLLSYQKGLEDRVAKSVLEYEKAQESLVRQSKMASMGEMLSMILHQWKQPISVIHTISSNIQVQEALGEVTIDSYKQAHKNIINQYHFMVETMHDFQAYLRPDNAPTVFDLKKAFDELFNLFAIQYTNKGVSLQFLTQETIAVNGLYNEYRQVILNIINNAQDIYEEKNIQEKNIDVSISKSADQGIVCIQDYAGGVPEEIIDKIFDMHMTTKNVFKGSGIGLHMAKEMIEKHMKGTLEVKNQNGGAAFIIRLPLAKR